MPGIWDLFISLQTDLKRMRLFGKLSHVILSEPQRRFPGKRLLRSLPHLCEQRNQTHNICRYIHIYIYIHVQMQTQNVCTYLNVYRYSTYVHMYNTKCRSLSLCASSCRSSLQPILVQAGSFRKGGHCSIPLQVAWGTPCSLFLELAGSFQRGSGLL